MLKLAVGHNLGPILVPNIWDEPTSLLLAFLNGFLSKHRGAYRGFGPASPTKWEKKEGSYWDRRHLLESPNVMCLFMLGLVQSFANL